MKKFTFTLHALLHLKESVEKQERNNLAVLTRKLRDLEAEREAMIARRDGAADNYGAKLAGGMAVSETQGFTDYFRMMKELLREQEARIVRASGEIEECRKRLVEILKEIRMLEKLREKQYAQYLAEVQAEEERTIGDFVSYQANLNPQEKRL
jgi:flagellar protein FliJ